MVGSRRSEVNETFQTSLCRFLKIIRNLAERCPGGQTNNRAELIVGIYVDGATNALTSTH